MNPTDTVLDYTMTLQLSDKLSLNKMQPRFKLYEASFLTTVKIVEKPFVTLEKLNFYARKELSLLKEVSQSQSTYTAGHCGLYSEI